MDELLVMILCAALAGMIIGSLGTLVTFWCCGFFERNSRTVSSTRFNPEPENALIQAGYGQPSASGEASSSVEMRRLTQSSILFAYMSEMLEQCTMSTVIVKAIQTMSRGSCQCVRFAGIHLWLLKLGRVFTFLNVVRDFTYLDVAVLSRTAQ